MRADGATAVANGLVSEFVKMEKLLKILPWFAGVPSHSTPSDAASRLEFNVPWLKGSRFVTVVLPPHLSQWGIGSGAPET